MSVHISLAFAQAHLISLEVVWKLCVAKAPRRREHISINGSAEQEFLLERTLEQDNMLLLAELYSVRVS